MEQCDEFGPDLLNGAYVHAVHIMDSQSVFSEKSVLLIRR